MATLWGAPVQPDIIQYTTCQFIIINPILDIICIYYTKIKQWEPVKRDIPCHAALPTVCARLSSVVSSLCSEDAGNAGTFAAGLSVIESGFHLLKQVHASPHF